jgi:hypothetical protein
MIRNIKIGRGSKEQQISILETPGTGRNNNRKFLLMISGHEEEAGVYLNREELQELNENIAQTIAMEINDESKI